MDATVERSHLEDESHFMVELLLGSTLIKILQMKPFSEEPILLSATVSTKIYRQKVINPTLVTQSIEFFIYTSLLQYTDEI